MGNVKLKLDEDTLFQAVWPTITAKTEQIAVNAGPGFVGDVIESRGKDRRPHGAVRSVTPEAYRENLKNNVLLKAVR